MHPSITVTSCSRLGPRAKFRSSGILEFTRPEQVRDCLSSLRITKTRYIIWNPHELDGWHGERSLGSDHLQPVRDYVRSFRTVLVFSDGTRVLESPSAGTAPEQPK